jgi:hypothetical protein
MPGIAESLLDGAELEIETTISPPYRVQLGGESSGVASRLAQLLRPRVTLLLNGQRITSVAPGGDPSKVRPYVLGAALAIAAAGALFLIAESGD